MTKFFLCTSLFIISIGILPLFAQKTEKIKLNSFRYEAYVDENLLANYFKDSPLFKEHVIRHLLSVLEEQYQVSTFNLENAEETSDAFFYELKNPVSGRSASIVPGIAIKARLTYDQIRKGNHKTEFIKLKLTYRITTPAGKREDKRKAILKLFFMPQDNISLPFLLNEDQFQNLFKEAFVLLFKTDKPEKELEWTRPSHPRYRDFVRTAEHFKVRQKGGKGFFKSKNTYSITSVNNKFNTNISLQLGGFLLGKSKNYLFRKDWAHRRYRFKDPEQELEYIYHSDKSLRKTRKSTGTPKRYRMLICKEKELLGAFSLAEYLDSSYASQIDELFGDTPPFSVMAGHYKGNTYHFRYLENDKISEIYENGELAAVFQESLSNKFHRRRSIKHELFLRKNSSENNLQTILRLYLAFTIARNAELKQIRYGD